MKRLAITKKKKLVSMNIVLMLLLISAMLAAVISGCSSDTKIDDSQVPGNLKVSPSEHKRDSDESGDETSDGDGSEESGNELTLSERYDVVRKGARLTMNYDKKSNSFKGIVENTTGNTLTKVRVEVHLSNGTELGPTTPVDLTPGEKVDVTLLATSEAFDGWIPHAEVGGSEHGDEAGEGNEKGSEHGSDGN